MTAVETPFFIAGGTVPPDAPSYVEREADRELLDTLRRGEYAYVLNSRQMGKSSLAVRAMFRLRDAGIRCAFVDLTKLGTSGVSEEQWYVGFVAELGRSLGIRPQAVAHLREHVTASPLLRLLSFLQDVVANLGETIVVFVDEVDAVRSLSFSTDGLFAAIRQCWNARSTEPHLKNLTFCLMGAALPGDLIRDPRMTPFNVGRRIELRDFSSDEAKAFAQGLPASGEITVRQVLEWTGGHPFLTQSICAELASGGTTGEVVRERYLSERARESDSNLADVGNRLLGRGDPDVTDEDRANTLSLYQKLLTGSIPDDESNAACARIKMSGVARLENARLTIRNRIYAEVFDAKWIRDNMPGQELRRQRKAYWQGVFRTAMIAGAIVTVVTILAILAWRNATRAEQLESQAARDRDIFRYDRYVATMQNMNALRNENNLMLIDVALKQVRGDPWKGWEYSYWRRVSHRYRRWFPLQPGTLGAFFISPDGKLGASPGTRGASIFDVRSGRKVVDIPFDAYAAVWLRDSRRLLLGSPNDIRLYDARSGRVLWKSPKSGLSFCGQSAIITTRGDKDAIFRRFSDARPAIVDMASGAVRPLDMGPEVLLDNGFEISPDGKSFVALLANGKPGAGQSIGFGDTAAWKVTRRYPLSESAFCFALSHNAKTAAVATASGEVWLIDRASGTKHNLGKFFPAIVQWITFSQDDRQMILSGRSRASVLVQIDHGVAKPVETFRESGIAGFVPRSDDIYSAYWGVAIYSAKALPETPTVHLPLGHAVGVGRIAPDGAVVASDGAGVTRQSLVGREPATATAKPSTYPTSDGRHWVKITPDGIELQDLQFRSLLSVKTDQWNVAVLSEDGSIFACKPDRDHIETLRVGKNEAPVKIACPQLIQSCGLTPDGRQLILGGIDGSVNVFRSADGQVLWKDRLDDSVTMFAVSADGKRLAGAANDDAVVVWDMTSGRCLARLVGHSESVTAVRWSPDGKRLATGSDDATVRLWDPERGTCLGIIGTSNQAIRDVSFLPGGRTLASLAGDGTVQLWMSDEKI